MQRECNFSIEGVNFEMYSNYDPHHGHYITLRPDSTTSEPDKALDIAKEIRSRLEDQHCRFVDEGCDQPMAFIVKQGDADNDDRKRPELRLVAVNDYDLPSNTNKVTTNTDSDMVESPLLQIITAPVFTKALDVVKDVAEAREGVRPDIKVTYFNAHTGRPIDTQDEPAKTPSRGR